MAGGNRDVVRFNESDAVLGSIDCSDCDTCGRVICSEDLLGRGVKTNRVTEKLEDEIKRNLTRDNGDTL